jgi:hypothetical protein
VQFAVTSYFIMKKSLSIMHLALFNWRSRPPLLKSPTGILSGRLSGVKFKPYVQADALSPWHLLSLLKWQKLGNIPVSIIAFDY